MEIILIILVSILVFINILAVVFYFWHKNNEKLTQEKDDENQDKTAQLLLQQINELSRTLDEKIGDSRKEVQESLRHQSNQSQQIIKDVTERLTKLDETNKQVLSFSDQLNKLQDTLTNPKHRGILGEYYLEETLKNVLAPNSFQMQYQFENGDFVDAVVFVKDKIIPIDSKFSLENYQRLLDETDAIQIEKLKKIFTDDLKTRINETSKYIRPNENTTEFAFMFIPSESIYYDLLINKVGSRDLIEYAFKEKHVVIVSPTSFLAYLQTVLHGLKAMQIEESAKEIRKKVEDLSRHITSYDSFMKKIGTHLGTTVNTYNSAYKEFKKIDKDVLKISGKGGEIEVLEIDKPNIDE